jgi:hypothetical protein
MIEDHGEEPETKELILEPGFDGARAVERAEDLVAQMRLLRIWSSEERRRSLTRCMEAEFEELKTRQFQERILLLERWQQKIAECANFSAGAVPQEVGEIGAIECASGSEGNFERVVRILAWEGLLLVKNFQLLDLQQK